MQNQQTSTPQYFEYSIQPGDTLSGIMTKMYGTAPGDSRFSKSREYLLSINPQIKDPNLIRAGDVLRLGEYPWSKAAHQQPAIKSGPTTPRLIIDPVPQQDREAFWALSWLEHNSQALTIPGSIALGGTSNLFSPGNQSLVTDVGDLYGQYKKGELTKGQYDYRRKLALDRLRNNLGNSEKWLFGRKTTHESVRIARRGGVPATAHIAKHADRIGKIAKFARGGGILLTGVGLTASCMEIAHTANQQEKNEILVETVGSTVTGIVGGALVGIFLVSNPIGWGAALVLAVGSVAVSYGAGKTARYAYTASGTKVDLVSGTGVGSLCR